MEKVAGGPLVLDSRIHQGQFGEDYVRALASAAGLVVHVHKPDVDGIDLGLSIPGEVNGLRSPMIEVQVKSASKPRRRAGEWYFDGLNEVQFNKLAGGDYCVPRFLFLVCVPANADEYASFCADGMLLRQLGYYLSLEDEDRVPQPDTRRRRPVRVPMSNVLTVRSLQNLVAPAPAVSLERAG